MSKEKNGRIVISESPRKNIQMVVYHNVDGAGRKASITRHEPLNPARSVYRRAFGKNV
jgi:hypothetical protein